MAREEQRERLVTAALRVAGEHGLAELTVRRIADAAGMSTMAVYSGFGGRAGVLEALYRRAFQMLAEAFEAVQQPSPHDDGGADAPARARYLIALALAYRSFALESPPRYSLMFDRAVADFTPSAELRAASLETAFGPLIGVVHGDLRKAYALWATMHGLVGLELAEVLATAPPSWGVVPDEGAAERMYIAGVRAVLAGLGLEGLGRPLAGRLAVRAQAFFAGSNGATVIDAGWPGFGEMAGNVSAAGAWPVWTQVMSGVSRSAWIDGSPAARQWYCAGIR
jgi:AcrR family transcriptional regulator